MNRLWRQVGPWHLTLVIGPSMGIAVLAILQARLLSWIVAGVFLDGRPLSGVYGLLAWLLGVIIARAALVWVNEVASQGLALRVKTGLRKRFLTHLFALGPVSVHGERAGELAATAVEGIEALDAYFSQYLPQVTLAALVPLTMLLVIAPVDPLSAVILLLTAPLLPLLAGLISRAADKLTRSRWKLLGTLHAHFLDVLTGLTTLKIFGQSRPQVRVIKEVSDRFRVTTLEVLRVAFLSALVLEIIATISTAIVAVTIGLRLLSGQMTFETGFFVLILLPEFYFPLRLLGARFHAKAAAATAAQRIFEILDTPARLSHVPPVQVPNVPRHTSATPAATLPIEVRFEAVGFAYTPGRRALAEVSFEIQHRQTIALVGPSGAGKSTIAHLLLRFIKPTEGQILANGVPLDLWPAADWYACVAWVPQTPYLFHDTLEANIKLGNPAASCKAVERAIRAAHLDPVVSRLPRGYKTVIGETGVRLSGGEAQLVALARAFLKDAPLLVLDEPTSHLDPALEDALYASVSRLMEGRTTLVIAHRLATVQRADQIIVLEKGRIVDAGTHAELMLRCELYNRLVHTGLGGDVLARGAKA
ncbi:MAG: thiol reductant ABC exporter subunit CydD [Armatimonadota bacterium]|nr:thiol reductant ABC exporter subunit CydD [Armatimonadota bacterium]